MKRELQAELARLRQAIQIRAQLQQGAASVAAPVAGQPAAGEPAAAAAGTAGQAAGAATGAEPQLAGEAGAAVGRAAAQAASQPSVAVPGAVSLSAGEAGTAVGGAAAEAALQPLPGAAAAGAAAGGAAPAIPPGPLWPAQGLTAPDGQAIQVMFPWNLACLHFQAGMGAGLRVVVRMSYCSEASGIAAGAPRLLMCPGASSLLQISIARCLLLARRAWYTLEPPMQTQQNTAGPLPPPT